MNFLFVIIVCVCAVQIRSDKCMTPNNEEGDCISFNSCAVLVEVGNDPSVEKFIEKSICGGSRFSPMVCCGPSSNFTTPSTNDSSAINRIQNATRKSLLPGRSFCGYQHSDDFLRSDNDTSVRITEFPWLAQIKHKSKINPEEKETFKCSGTLINNRYVLTAAFCVVNPENTAVGVRLGEYNVINKTDCVLEEKFEQECSLEVEDFGIEKIIPHPRYHPRTFANSIALIRLDRKVPLFTDYIRPICLPIPGTQAAKAGDVLLASGWGYRHTEATGKKVEVKKKIFTRLITNEECVSIYRAKGAEVEAGKITENFMCTLQLRNNTDLECLGDSGGPVAISKRLQWEQLGITAYGKGCRYLEYPKIQVRVEKYVTWIEENLEP